MIEQLGVSSKGNDKLKEQFAEELRIKGDYLYVIYKTTY